jgi:hypothetical protein
MIRSFQWDLARQVERLDWLIAQLPRYAEWGYHELHLHLEDAVEYPSLPGVARRDAYTYRQFGKLVDAASRAGIKVVPIVNLLGHTQYLIKVPELRDLNELRAPDGSPLPNGQICPLHPRTLEVAEKLLRDMAPFCTAGKVHVGLDESFHLGRHPLSKKEISRIGLGAHFARYVQRLHGLVRSHDLKMGLWGDMLYFIPDAIPLLPQDVTIYEWYYYAFRTLPKAELFNFAPADLATPLKKHGLDIYGCPMNGAFRYEPLPHFADRLGNILSWWRHCERIGARGFLVSSWEPYRLAIELTTAVDAAAASLWLNPGLADPRAMLRLGFERAFGKKARASADLALACDRYPFGGYPRWQINERWDTISRRESLAGYRREAAHFDRLASAASRLKAPVSLRISIALRRALAKRDVAIRALARAAISGSNTSEARTHDRAKRMTEISVAASRQLMQAIRDAQAATRAVWARTRTKKTANPTELILLRDEARLRSLQQGRPVFGTTWQLCYEVWNHAPALQLVGVEQQDGRGVWQPRQSCHTIEFQTKAAQRRASIVREHAAPVEWDGDVQRFPRLRLFVRGLGTVKLGRIELTDTNERFRIASRRTWHQVGSAAPIAGLPELDWSRNTDELALTFVSTRKSKTAVR